MGLFLGWGWFGIKIGLSVGDQVECFMIVNMYNNTIQLLISQSPQKTPQKMSSYSRQQIESIIARNKKRSNNQKSPSPPLSPKSIVGNRSNSPKDMAARYQELCAKYKNLLEDVKDKNQMFQMQAVELERLRLEKERDQKELYRLRSIIGFIKKEDKGTQVNMDMQSAGSWSTKLQKSTAIEYQQDMDWSTPIKQTQSFKLLRKKSPQSPQSKQLHSATTIQKNGYKTHTHDMYDNGDSGYSRVNVETIYTPKNYGKEGDSGGIVRDSRHIDGRYSKLSNSPYSKLRFSRNM